MYITSVWIGIGTFNITVYGKIKPKANQGIFLTNQLQKIFSHEGSIQM